MNRKYIFILVFILLIVVGSIYVFNTRKESVININSNNAILPSRITFQDTQYVPAKCIALPSATIKNIGKTNDGIDVFSDESTPEDKKSTGILIKMNGGNYQCYVKK